MKRDRLPFACALLALALLALAPGAAAKRKVPAAPAVAAQKAASVPARAGVVEAPKSRAPVRGSVVEFPSPPPPASARETVQRESRIEFDERLVQGQTAAGAPSSGTVDRARDAQTTVATGVGVSRRRRKGAGITPTGTSMSTGSL